MIQRFHKAKVKHLPYVECWGDSSPLREFMYVDDLAELSIFLMNSHYGASPINAGSGEEVSIKHLTELIALTVGYEGEIRWDTSIPNGILRKLLDLSRSQALGWKAKTTLEEGLKLTYQDYLNKPKHRFVR